MANEKKPPVAAPVAPTMSKRDAFRKRVQDKYPDKDFSDDEDFYGQLNDDYDGYEKELDEYRTYDKQLGDMMTRDPRSAAFLLDMRDGRDPLLGLVRRMGADAVRALLDDPKKQDELAEANKAYLDRVTEDKKFEDEYNANIAESIKMLQEREASGELSSDELDDAFGFLMEIIHDGVKGIFKPETIDLAIKALRHDSDVADAAQEGEVRGRNSRISEKLRKRESGDGMPQLAGKNRTTPPPKSRDEMDIFELARGAR